MLRCHIVVDPFGLMAGTVVHGADAQDLDGAASSSPRSPSVAMGWIRLAEVCVGRQSFCSVDLPGIIAMLDL